MPLPHFPSGKDTYLFDSNLELLSDSELVRYPWFYDIMFVYNSTMEFQIVENVEFNFDFENDNRELRMETNQSDRLKTNVEEVDIIVMLIYDKTGLVHERKIYEAKLNKMRSIYSVLEETPKIELTFRIISETTHGPDTEHSLESWIKERRRERKIDELMK
jgi:hypothetical protein